MKAPIPKNEAERLKALRLYKILDTASERSFDELAGLAAMICEAPICAITLIDENRQWFKSIIGLEAEETSRDVAFCAHAILQDELTVVPDAREDSRFADNPYVLTDPNVRFYAGAPLTVEGKYNLGTLCVVDKRPRTLDERQKNALSTIRNAVITQLEIRRAFSYLQSVEQLLPICAWCKKIRTEEGGWLDLQDYVAEAKGVTHGICGLCAKSWTSAS